MKRSPSNTILPPFPTFDPDEIDTLDILAEQDEAIAVLEGEWEEVTEPMICGWDELPTERPISAFPLGSLLP